MPRPDLAVLIQNAQRVVESVGRESVDVYVFLAAEFARGPIAHNYVFQFVYRSFYRLDNAGLTSKFKATYFECMEDTRGALEIDIAAIAEKLREIRNLKGETSLQFSFVTKLANTVNPDYPIYDAEVAKVFAFRAPLSYKPFHTRLQEYLAFYGFLRQFYEEMIAQGSLKELVTLFEKAYSPAAARVPAVKVLDFIFWSAGKLLRRP